MKAYKHLVKSALKRGYNVSVWDCEEWAERKSTHQKAIFAAIESVEEAQIMVRDKEGNVLGWALIVPFGLEDDETVVDASGLAFWVPNSIEFGN
jgi:hypothetical protein